MKSGLLKNRDDRYLDCDGILQFFAGENDLQLTGVYSNFAGH